MARLYEFGCATDARDDGFPHLTHTVDGTVDKVMASFADKDVALVKGAALAGLVGGYEFAVLQKTASTIECADR